MSDTYDGIFRFEAFDSGGSPVHVVAETRAGNCLVLEDSHAGGRVGGCKECMDVIKKLKERRK